MAKTGAKNRKADIVAGVIVVLVALALLTAVIFSIREWAGILLSWGNGSGSGETQVSTTQPPAPTLVPNPYDNNDFTYDANGYLTCLAGESWLGVDVSEYQGSIDWDQVAQAGVQFAMVRLGYRGWGTEGVVREDSRWLSNLEGAAEAGLQVGVYFFSQAISEEEAIEEAQFLLRLLDGRQLDMPIVFDWETVSSEEARTNGVTAATLNACALAFCREVEAAGYESMVYFNTDLAKWKLDLLSLQEAGIAFWLAMYTDSLRSGYQVDMWQYSCTGSVPGIATKVDLNLYFPQ